jgi:hypothetical protein
MLDVMATRQGLDTQDVIQMKAFVTGNGCWRAKDQRFDGLDEDMMKGRRKSG